MAQEIKIVARTFELDKVAEISGYSIEDLENNTNSDLTLLAGKAAGVCYMPDDYFENGVQNEEKALARATSTSKSGHHSVYDHGQITLVVTTNKMMAMILNSLGVYATSEKSARYTKMQPETELELELYNKWTDKIQELIIEKYPDTDDDILNTRLCKKLGIDKTVLIKNNKISVSLNNFDHLCNEDKLLDVYNILAELKKSDTLPSRKLAMENARYMISVFTPTTMLYTMSFRQMHLIIDYLYKLEVNCKDLLDNFSTKLYNYCKELREEFERVLGEQRIYENKNQYIRFLEYQHKSDLVGITNRKKLAVVEDEETRLKMLTKGKKEVIGDSYTLVYGGSLAMLAQAQRHRTIRYTMYLKEAGQFGFYIPPILRNTELAKEWTEDIKSVAYCIPQGTMVRITEQGIFEDFVLKCKERLCGRAQLEIANITKENMEKFIDNCDNLSGLNQLLLDSVTSDDEVIPRCMFSDFRCTEGCKWGAKAFERLI